MTLTQLRYAVAVDTHRHFGRAAEACHITQPTLSVQLQKLEDELGVVIFDRQRSPVEPTDIGQMLLGQARNVLQQAARLPEIVMEARGHRGGELRLGILPTLAPYILPVVAQPLAKRFPDVVVHIRELRTEEILSELVADRLDAGLIATEEQGASLVSEFLFEEPFAAYVGADHPLAERSRLSVDELRHHDVWLLAEGHCFRDQVLQLCGARGGMDGPLRFESGTIDTLRRLVDERGGVTLIPATAIRSLGRGSRERIRYFEDPVPSRVVRLVHGQAFLKRTLIVGFGEVVRNAIGRMPAQLHISVHPQLETA